jgi:hypothetical protein
MYGDDGHGDGWWMSFLDRGAIEAEGSVSGWNNVIYLYRVSQPRA